MVWPTLAFANKTQVRGLLGQHARSNDKTSAQFGGEMAMHSFKLERGREREEEGGRFFNVMCGH